MMEIQCRKCRSRYRIDDSKHRGKQRVKIPCRQCQNLITVDFADEDPTPQAAETDWRQLLPADILQGEALKREVTGNFKKLYPMPHVMWKARRLMSDPNMNFKDLSSLLKTDQALASRILKAANSAYFGLTGKVSSIQQASVLLGTKLLFQIIGMIGHSKTLNGSMKGYAMDTGNVWRHALTVAVGSDIIARKMAPEYSGEAFLTGLLHDAGKIILDPYILERQAAFLEVLGRESGSLVDAEKKVLGFDHAHIGGELCLHWNLPDFVADAIACHHVPSGSRANLLAYIIHAADTIANRINVATFETDLAAAKDDGLKFLQMADKDLEAVAYRILDAVENLEDATY